MAGPHQGVILPEDGSLSTESTHDLANFDGVGQKMGQMKPTSHKVSSLTARGTLKQVHRTHHRVLCAVRRPYRGGRSNGAWSDLDPSLLQRNRASSGGICAATKRSRYHSDDVSGEHPSSVPQFHGFLVYLHLLKSYSLAPLSPSSASIFQR